MFLYFVLSPGPEQVDSSLPSYPGFERDVFGVVKDYFHSLPEPLMTYDMYEVITNVYGGYISKLQEFCYGYC